jgi:hypothetical protein
MKTSEQTNELFTALAKAQGELSNVLVDAKNPHFKNEYATLDSLLEKIRPIFSKNGLALIQVPLCENDKHFLETMVTHSSGQFYSSTMALICSKNDMQQLGSAMTYARRYMAEGAAGVTKTQDDDAEGATVQDAKPKDPVQPKVPNIPSYMTDNRIKMIYALCKEAKWSEDHLRKFVKHQFGLESNRLLTREQFEILIAHLKTKPGPFEELK